MHVIDIEGNRIEVTDVTAAIEQADRYCRYEHEDPAYRALDNRLRHYWQDIHAKLLQLQSDAANY